MTEPLGFFGIDNDDPQLENIDKEQALKFIKAASLTLSWKDEDLEEAIDEVQGDLSQLCFNYRDILSKKLFNNYRFAIIHQPIELIKWAVQFVKR